jgi:hypothetical protein
MPARNDHKAKIGNLYRVIVVLLVLIAGVLMFAHDVTVSAPNPFCAKPFRLILPNLGDLYQHLEAYIDRIAGCC